MIDRWKRGLVATAFLTAAAMAAFLAVGLPMFILGEAFGLRMLQSFSSIALASALIGLPLTITTRGASRAILSALGEGRS